MDIKDYLVAPQGRVKITCDLAPTGNVEQDKIIIPKIIELTKAKHEANVGAMTKLRSYYYNITDILSKTKTQQPNINNKIAINYPSIAVSTINSYCFSNPLTFSAEGDDIDKVEALNKAMKADRYKEKSEYMRLNSAITALGYRYIEPPTQEQIDNGIYFVTHCDLLPEQTYCVYSNDLKKEKICAITFQDRQIFDENLNAKTVKVYTVFTKWHKWEFYKSARKWTNNAQYGGIDENGDDILYDAYPLPYRKIPIVENLRKADGTGDYEQALDLIDAANSLVSSRLDDVQQSVDYILTLRDIDGSDEGIERAQKAKGQGMMFFKSVEGATVQPEIKVLNVPQNQTALQSLQDFICNKIEEVLNIPNRETNSSGGDNGVAVEARNGTRSLENIAGLVTTNAINTENETLEVIMAICNNIPNCPFRGLKANQVNVKDNRNRSANIATATSSCATLIGAGFNDYDAIRITNLDSNPKTVADRNAKFREEQEERELELKEREQQSKTAQATIDSQNNNGTNSGDTAV